MFTSKTLFTFGMAAAAITSATALAPAAHAQTSQGNRFAYDHAYANGYQKGVYDAGYANGAAYGYQPAGVFDHQARPATPGGRTNLIDDRIARQDAQLARLERRGSIAPRTLYKARSALDEVRHRQQVYTTRNYGGLTRAQSNELNRMLDLNQRIYSRT